MDNYFIFTGLTLGLVFLTVLLSFFYIHSLATKTKIEMTKRMVEMVGQPQNPTVREKELSEPIARRVIKPFGKRLAKLAIKMLPLEKEAFLTKRLTTAGNPRGLGPKEFIAVKLVLASCCTAFLILTGPALHLNSSYWLLFLTAATAIGWLLPNLYLSQKIRQRKGEIEKALPDVLDLITVSMEAGMGFDGAILKVAEKSKGPLASELMIMLQECKMGKKRSDSLRDMAGRMEVDDLTTFTGSVIMAEQLGISLGQVLRLQSEQVRHKRRQRAEEKAMKAPVKMLIPMVICIFPTIFVILLGPAVISLYKAFAP